MPSGLMAICFSTITLMNIANGALFFRTTVEAGVFIGALLGLAGLGLVFWPEIAGFGLHSRAGIGLALSLVATASASLGNMVSVRHKRVAIPVIESNAIGMAYGALCSLSASPWPRASRSSTTRAGPTARPWSISPSSPR